MIGRVTWRGLTLGTGTPYGITKVDGWEDVETDADDEDRTNEDGEHPGELRANARVVTVEGHLLDPGAEARRVAALRAATPVLNTLDVLTVEQHGETLTIPARLRRRSLPQDMGYGSGWSDWFLQWRAPDPRRWTVQRAQLSVGLPVITGGRALPATLPTSLGSGSTGRLVIPNTGNASYRPVLRVTGPVPGFQVTDLPTGRRLRYEGTLAAGEFVDLDCQRRRALLAGTTDRRGLLTLAQWIEVPRGGTELAFTSLAAVNTVARLSGDLPMGAHL